MGAGRRSAQKSIFRHDFGRPAGEDTPMAASAASARPAVRARYMQLFSKQIERLPVPEREAISAAIGRDVIESASAMSWLPLAVNLEATRAVAERLGPERTDRFFRGLLLDTAHSPLLGSVVQTALRVAGRNPGLSLPWIAKGFQLIFRDMGGWTTVRRDTGILVMELAGLPAECVSDDVWARSVASALSALLDLARLEGSVAVAEVDRASGRVVFEARWAVR